MSTSKRIALALITLALLASVAAQQAIPQQQHAQAQCSTDEECMRLCPPTDCECDGGPQS